MMKNHTPLSVFIAGLDILTSHASKLKCINIECEKTSCSCEVNFGYEQWRFKCWLRLVTPDLCACVCVYMVVDDLAWTAIETS